MAGEITGDVTAGGAPQPAAGTMEICYTTNGVNSVCTGNLALAAVPLAPAPILVVVLALVAFGIALYTDQGRAFLELLKEARVEGRKIVWPSKQETWQTTLIVAGVVVATSLLLWLIDTTFGWLVTSVIG